MVTYLNIADESASGLNLSATYDVSSGDKTWSREISTESISLSINADSLTGTLDATVKVYKSNTNTFADAVQEGSTITLSTAAYNEIIDLDIWNARYIFVELKVNSCTGGTLLLPITIK